MGKQSNYKTALPAFSKKVKKSVIEARRETLTALTTEIVNHTPVDTGRARAHWHASIGAPDESISEAVDPSGGATIRRAAEVIKRLEIGERLFITNPLPYIHRLENGYSQQAPAGMVTLARAKFSVLFKRFVKIQLGK